MKGRGIKRSVAEALELPREVVLNLPLLSLTGREEAVIENYKGIIEYTEECIRILTAIGVIRLTGKNLLLKQLTSECIVITGGLLRIEFVP